MNKDIILQSLTESFEALKDSWGLFCDFINNCSIDIYAMSSELKGTNKCIGGKRQIV